MEKPIKIVFLTHYTSLYGANRSLINLIVGLKEGFNIQPLVIIPGHGDITDALKEHNIDYVVGRFGIGAHIKFREKLKIPFRAAKHLWELLVLRGKIVGFKPDLIQSNSSIILMGFYLSRLLHVPHIWHFREFSKEHYNFKYDFGERWFTKLLQKSELVIAISESIAEYVLRKCPANVKVVYNGIFSRHDLKTRPTCRQEDNGPFVFAIIGKIAMSKGQLETVKAFKRAMKKAHNIKLLIIGDSDEPEYEKRIKEEIDTDNLTGKIELLGYVKDVAPFYQKINALLMCSSWEAFGRVTVEALSNGVPVIGYNACGTSEIIHNRINGLLFNDFNELPDLMSNISTDQELYDRLRSNSSMGLDAFTIEKSARAFYDEISKILL